MSNPVLRMGLIGFPDENYLCNLLKTRIGQCRWERGPFIEADALWVNGEHAQVVRGSFVRIPSNDPQRPATLLNLKELDRPAAFTLPLPSPDVQPPDTFDPHSVASIDSVFRKFEAWLQPLTVELVVAHAIAQRRFSLTSTVYHLVLNSSLVGVVDLEGYVGLMPSLTPAQAAGAQWCGRPPSAGQLPSHFSRTPISLLMWQYVTRSNDDMLPARYRDSVIYFRGPPNVPPRLLRDTHILLLGQLNSAPQTLAQLHERTGLSEREIAQALAALYFAGGITTQGRKGVWSPRARGRVDAARAGLPSSLLDGADSDMTPRGATDLTVPASLEMLRPTRGS